MTTVFQTMGVVDHSTKRFDIPDIERDLKKIYDDTSYELSYLDFSTDEADEDNFNKQKDKVESGIEELKSYAAGSEISEYKNYTEELERRVEALTWCIINASRRADKMAQDILSVDNTMDRNEISDQFNYIVSDATSELFCNETLRWCLENRGWNKSQLDYIGSIVPLSTCLELLLHASSPDDMIVGVDGWIAVSDGRCTLWSGDDLITFTKAYGGLSIHATINGVISSFNTADLKDIFMDILNPTENEIQMYEMAYHKAYDICKWRDIFGPGSR
ncbi:hypothetical protein SPLA5a_PHROGS00167 [Salmonella phage SPLA5a]|nr:hypothetical protein SPLA5a_PHROGS00167 [Salmonella phage SPLA5a]